MLKFLIFLKLSLKTLVVATSAHNLCFWIKNNKKFIIQFYGTLVSIAQVIGHCFQLFSMHMLSTFPYVRGVFFNSCHSLGTDNENVVKLNPFLSD